MSATHEERARAWLSAEEQMAKANWPMGRPSEIYVASLAAEFAAVERDARAESARLRDELRLADDLLLRLAAMTAHCEALREALRAVEYFGPADGTHGACLDCGRSDMLPHDDGCQLGHYIGKVLASSPATSLAAAKARELALVERAVRATWLEARDCVIAPDGIVQDIADRVIAE